MVMYQLNECTASWDPGIFCTGTLGFQILVKPLTLMHMAHVDSAGPETLQRMESCVLGSEQGNLDAGECQLRFSDRVTIIQQKTLVCSFTDPRAQALLKPCFQVRTSHNYLAEHVPILAYGSYHSINSVLL